ncbi:MAG: hypothetical protein F6K28_02205 [Microcoleus sp. SIO2G3]|nr:hypothetical protein [Microcoleus sp. SIO2G3]
MARVNNAFYRGQEDSSELASCSLLSASWRRYFLTRLSKN